MRSIVVIGAGWAGIAAAVEAADHGWGVTLVEERPYVGGRARSFVDRTTGEEIDNGQHLMMGCYHSALSVLRSLGTIDLVRRQASLRVRFLEAGGIADELRTDNLPGSAGVALGIMRLREMPLAARLAILRLSARLRLGVVRPAGYTCRDFLEREGQPLAAIKRFWEPIILATLNAPMHLAAADLLVAVMRLAFLGSREDASLFLPSAGLSDLVEPIGAYLEARGGRVITSEPCDTLEVVQGAVTRVHLRSGEVLSADAVVLAMPQRSVARLLPEAIDKIGKWETEASPIVSVYLWYSENWMTDPFVAALGTVVQWVFNRRLIHETTPPEIMEEYPGHVSLTISAGSELAGKSIPEIVSVADAELRTLFPEMAGARLLHGVAIKEKLATPLITPVTHRPQADALVSVASNLRLAGDWTDTGLPATIEGAARSGIHAVRDLSAAKRV